MTTRALVTGAGGFVGRHLRDHLEACGDEVTGVDVDCDVTDVDAVRDAVALAAPDVVYHLAARTHVGESWHDQAGYNRVNVLGTANVLRAVRERARDAVVVLVSSADVYGVVRPGDLPLVESSHPVPVSPYAQSKFEAEQVALDAVRSSGQRVIIVRPFNHLGPGQSPTFLVPALVNRLLDARERGDEAIAVGDLSARRDFTDVRDVVRAYRLLVEYADAGEIFNVASGVDVAVETIARELVALIAPRTRLEVDPSLLRPVEIPVLRGDATKLRERTGWSPATSLDASLRDVVADAQKLRQQR